MSWLKIFKFRYCLGWATTPRPLPPWTPGRREYFKRVIRRLEAFPRDTITAEEFKMIMEIK